jgi:hypothetical protein
METECDHFPPFEILTRKVEMITRKREMHLYFAFSCDYFEFFDFFDF